MMKLLTLKQSKILVYTMHFDFWSIGVFRISAYYTKQSLTTWYGTEQNIKA